MVATDHGEVVGKFVAAQDRNAGYEDLISQICKTRDIKSCLPEHVGNHIKAVVIPLHAGFVRGVRAELVKPGAQERVVIGMNRASSRKARQRLQIGILLQVVGIAVPDKNLVSVAELVIEAAGCLVFARIEGKQSTVTFELADQVRTPRGQLAQTRTRSYGQSLS